MPISLVLINFTRLPGISLAFGNVRDRVLLSVKRLVDNARELTGLPCEAAKFAEQIHPLFIKFCKVTALARSLLERWIKGLYMCIVSVYS